MSNFLTGDEIIDIKEREMKHKIKQFTFVSLVKCPFAKICSWHNIPKRIRNYTQSKKFRKNLK